MFCTKCGQPTTPETAFCSHCGNPLTGVAEPQATPEPPAQEWRAQPPYTAPQSMPYQQNYYVPQPPAQVYAALPEKKKKTGLIIGLVLGGVAVLAIIAVLLFVWPGFLNAGTPVVGTWYSENRGEAIRFGSGSSFDAYTTYGEFEGDYQYEPALGEGRIDMSDGHKFDFVVEKDRLYVYDMGTFDKAEDGFDIEVFIEDAK